MELNQHRSCSQHGGRCMIAEVLVSQNELREENLLCDAVLRLEDGGVFPVHRVILSTCSAYFRKLFTSTLNTSEKTDILLHGISSDLMSQILDYIYLRKVDIHCDNARQLLMAAEYLCIGAVTELCCDFLKDTTDLDNCIGIMRFARCHFCADLEAHTRSFVLRHFVRVSQQSGELLELPVEELQEIITSEELNAKDEETVWECILRWINHDPDNRKRHIVGLLKDVRLGLLDTNFFLEKVSTHPYVTENEACRPVVLETLAFLHDVQMITKEDKDFLIPKIALPRIPQDILFAIGGYRGESPTALIETYDTRADRWSVMEEVYQKDERFSHGTALVGFNIYVIGGSNGNRALSSCRCFNVVTKTWRQVAPMHECRSEVTVAVLGEIVYAMGGCGLLLLEEQRTAEKYDYKTNQWSLIAPMNMDRCDADKIYIAGGCGNYLILSTVEVYDPVTDQWTFVAPLHSERSSLRCVVFHGILYALGGFNEVSRSLSAEKFDPAEDTWTEIHDMCVARQNFSAHVIDDTIFIIDGYHGDETIFSVECFNSKKNEWYHATEMNVRRTGMSICVVKNLPNAKDYAHKHRDEIMEKIRKKLLAWETQRQQAFDYNLDEHTKFNHVPQENNEENWDLM